MTALTLHPSRVISYSMKRKLIHLSICLSIFLTSCTSTTPILSTGTPNPTLAAGIKQTDSPIPTPSPSPTPTPEVRIETGEVALFNGDYDRSYIEFQTALATSSDPALQAASLWGLARVLHALNNNTRAIETLWELTSKHPDSPNAVRAYFMMGEIFNALERYSEAAQAYTIYLTLRPGLLDAYVQEKRGDAYTLVGNYIEALAAYQAALNTSHNEDRTGLQIKIAQAHSNLGDPTSALGMYDSIYSTSSNDYVKAQMDLLTGRIYLSLNQPDQAYQRFKHAVDNYPLSPDSYNALVALVNADIPVDDMNRGLTDYFAGQFGYAHDAFQRYLEANPQNDGTALYYKALSLFYLGQYENAVQTWDEFIRIYPNNPHWAAAWNGNLSLPGRAFTQWYFLGQYDIAAQTLVDFVKYAPVDANAPIYLLETGRILERDGKLQEAAQTWDRVADEYPWSDLVPQSLFWAGLARYRLGNYNDALVSFQRNSILSTQPDDQARALFWIGKTQQVLGELELSQATFQQAAALDPTDYYSLRSQDILFNRPAFVPVSSVDLNVDLKTERIDAEAWMRVTFNLPADTDLSNPGTLALNPSFKSGTEFLQLGLSTEARAEFDTLRTAIETNPADCFRLANYLLEMGQYYPAIFSIRQILTLAGMNTQSQTLAAPVYFNHIRYGMYYKELILQSAQNLGLDPLFLFSVMRQESLFDKLAHSSYAIGLMQITPDTGQTIVNNHGWPPNFSSEDLYRPMVSISLGSAFLNDQRLRFNGDLFTTLAAYNAGPEAAPIWRDLSGSDSDLFLEIIRFEETRNYIRSIYEIFDMYRKLYSPGP
jgi:soluble lytic murein transglycosylase